MVPALKEGWLGAVASEPGQGPAPEAGTLVVKELERGTLAPSGVLQGVISEVVVCLPQGSGVFSAARGPSKRVRLTSSIGSSGLSLKVVVIWPVWGSVSTLPASLETTPVWG